MNLFTSTRELVNQRRALTQGINIIPLKWNASSIKQAIKLHGQINLITNVNISYNLLDNLHMRNYQDLNHWSQLGLIYEDLW